MKDRLIQSIANLMISVSKHYEGNVSPRGYYKPRKIKWIDGNYQYKLRKGGKKIMFIKKFFKRFACIAIVLSLFTVLTSNIQAKQKDVNLLNTDELVFY